MSVDFAALLDLEHVPSLIVFDLDGCTWEPEMYMLSSEPRVHEGVLCDSSGEEVYLLEGFLEAMSHLTSHPHFAGSEIALASRTHYSERADICLQHLQVDGRPLQEHVAHQEIFPGDKKSHFKSLKAKSGVHYHDMVFFDDQQRNCQSVGSLGGHLRAHAAGHDAGPPARRFKASQREKEKGTTTTTINRSLLFATKARR